MRNNKIIIYLKLNKNQTPASVDVEELLEDIRSRSAKSLTYYMVPKYAVVVTEFPQTANGKIDKKALPDPPEILAPPVGSPLSLSVASSVTATENRTKMKKQGGMVGLVLDIVERQRDLDGMCRKYGHELMVPGDEGSGPKSLLGRVYQKKGLLFSPAFGNDPSDATWFGWRILGFSFCAYSVYLSWKFGYF